MDPAPQFMGVRIPRHQRQIRSKRPLRRLVLTLIRVDFRFNKEALGQFRRKLPNPLQIRPGTIKIPMKPQQMGTVEKDARVIRMRRNTLVLFPDQLMQRPMAFHNSPKESMRQNGQSNQSPPIHLPRNLANSQPLARIRNSGGGTRYRSHSFQGRPTGLRGAVPG